jgi:hypothetical protein
VHYGCKWHMQFFIFLSKLSHHTPWRRLGERMYSSYSFSTSALDGGEWSASRPNRALAPGKDPRYPLYRRLGGPESRSGHRGYKKILSPLPGIESQSPGRPTRSQTLYWLSYPAHTRASTHIYFFIPAVLTRFSFWVWLPSRLPSLPWLVGFC